MKIRMPFIVIAGLLFGNRPEYRTDNIRDDPGKHHGDD